MKQRLADWAFFFVHAYRYEAGKMSPEEAQYLEPFLKEQTLAKPCQVEVIQFSKPYRIVLLFLLDKTKSDLQIRIRQEKWHNLEEILINLNEKYSSLRIKHQELRKLLERCRNCQNKIIYGIDFVRNVCMIYFTHNPRKKVSPLPLVLNCSKPQDVAEMIFRLNIDQSSTYFIDKL